MALRTPYSAHSLITIRLPDEVVQVPILKWSAIRYRGQMICLEPCHALSDNL